MGHLYIWLRTDCIELPSLPNNTAVKHLYTNRSGAKCWLSLGRRSGGDWANTWHWAERFAVCLWNGKQQQQHSYCHILLLIAFLEGALIRNVIYVLCIDGNNAVINNNLWKAPRPSFALQNRHWHAKGYFLLEIYRLFGHAPSNISTNRGLCKSLLYFKAGLANMRPSITWIVSVT